jgi:hypothetical protein
LLATPFVTLTVDANGERGLLGVAFDQTSPRTSSFTFYYTSPTPATHNQVSRFTANGDVALAGSEVPIFDLNNLSGATTPTAAPRILGRTEALHRGGRECQRRKL